jgi:tRNA(His) 5'-end guanylyltransferase
MSLDNTNTDLLNPTISINEPVQKPGKTAMDQLGDRMKSYEEKFETSIPPYEAFIFNSDLSNCSAFSRKLPKTKEKPFNKYFQQSMVLSACDLIKDYPAFSIVYTHSDEITGVVKPMCTRAEYYKMISDKEKNLPSHLLGGRVCKIVSELASFVVVRFNFHMNTFLSEYPEDFDERSANAIQQCRVISDGRVVSFRNELEYEIINRLFWRSIYDSSRNAISTYADAHYSVKQLFQKSSEDKIAMLKEKGIDWELDVPLDLKHGVYCKRESYEINTIDKHTSTAVKAIRTKISCRSFKIKFTHVLSEYGQDMTLEMLYSPKWNDVDKLNASLDENTKIKFVPFELLSHVTKN